MKYILFILFFAGCVNNSGYTLIGNVPEVWEGKPVYLTLNDTYQSHIIDSTKISNGKFKFQGNFEIPRYCSVCIYLDPNDRQTRSKIINFSLFIDSTTIEANCDNSGKTPVFNISGSNTQDAFQNYTDQIQPLQADRKKTFTAYTQAYYYGNDLAKAIELAKQTTAKAQKIQDAQIKYIQNHPESVISLHVAQELCKGNLSLSRQETEQLFTTLSPRLQESEMGKSLRETIQRKQVFIGQPFLDKELTAPDGSSKKISDFVEPGHVTLIEFWASWCQPCRAEFPHIQKTYDKYHPKGFNIVSISIDSKRENWLSALKEENLSWGQLLDRKTPPGESAFKAYNLTGIPSSILVDAQGNILNVNARGGWLDAAMQEIYD